MSEPIVHGYCEPRFHKVREAFAENLAGADVGAAVAIYQDGEPVVDLWGGWADKARTRPWRQNTLVTVYSTTKGPTAICAHRLVEQGKLDLDAPVTKYWPEFAQAGKQDIPVHMLLSHRSGLPSVDEKLPEDAIYNWETMTDVLAKQAPLWEPGTKHGYHGMTYGWLVGEVVRRVSGKSLGTFWRDEVAKPLGLEFYIGIGPEHDYRIAEMLAQEIPAGMEETAAKMREAMLANMDSAVRERAGNIPMTPGGHNSEGWRRAEIPAANGHADARSVARVYGALAVGGDLEGVHVLSDESIDRATVEQAQGPDAMIVMPTRYGLGFWLSRPEAPMGANPRNFGHPGAGGSVGFTDRDERIGFGYVMNQMKAGLLVGSTGAKLIDAMYASL